MSTGMGHRLHNLLIRASSPPPYIRDTAMQGGTSRMVAK